MKFDKKYINTRITVIVVIAALVMIAIITKSVITATVEHDKWKEVGEVSVGKPEKLPAARGNILSADGQLMASSLPDYKVYIDFLSGIDRLPDSTAANGSKIRVYDPQQVHEKDSMWEVNLDTICRGLAEICPRYTYEEHLAHLTKGLKEHKRYWDVSPRVVLNFIQYNDLMRLPVFNLKNRYTSGLTIEPRNNRNKPFGSLARRTLGEMFGAKDSARSGLELAYDSLLRGEPGQKHNKKVLSKYLSIVDKEPVDGYDLVSTIDVSMQDICESALREKLHELEASMGVVVLMEVKTGDVKAIVNLMRYDDGEYYEARNYALAALMEPGSTFKTASILVALDDGYITTSDRVETGSGICNMYGASMKDHNWHRGGYGTIDVPHVLMFSSNVGVSKLIDKHYHNQPEKFVEGLRRVGIGTPLGLPFDGAADPVIRTPHKDIKGGYRMSDNWSATALAWMSIGYETQIPPISTVSFYNAIANNGKMVRPRFVKGIAKNGEMVEEFPVEVIKPHICSQHALDDIQGILYRVVNDKEGLGKRAGNPYFHVSGKTGTAQVATGGGYKAGHNEHLVSFCGYYPSEDPKYTCIVAIRHAYYVASGGGQAGPVFSKIAQRVYSKNVTTDINLAKDSTAVLVPTVKDGNVMAARYVLDQLGMKSKGGDGYEWGTAYAGADAVEFQSVKVSDNIVPNVTGMGAKDAVYALSQRGMKVRVSGRGRVTHQSVPSGSKVVKGQTVSLELK
ncbi:MAG: transpeptidase family protein [Bacteroidaceae bacterium]|jgi:cell division protein FtsI (penicillin-binding protein 3)|nr:transpeptidase family protein [Bacteroidaceae bacterium]